MRMAKALIRVKPTNVTLDPTLVEEAKALKINVSRACEQGLAERISEEKMRQWNERNQARLASWNEYVKEDGLPLARYRQF